MNVQRDAESRINLHSINLKPLAADPDDVRDGDVWYFDDGMTRALKVRINGATKTVTVS